MSEPETSSGTWLQKIGRARRIVLFMTPGLLVLFLISSANADHFGWGFLPWLVLLVVLPLGLVYVLGELVVFGAAWLLGPRSPRVRAAAGSRPVAAILAFDLVVLGLYLVAWLTILVHDHWFA